MQDFTIEWIKDIKKQSIRNNGLRKTHPLM